MLVSHRHRFIYTKTRKTAGTSVESYFEPYCMADGEWEQIHRREEYVSEHGIIGARKNKKGCRWSAHMNASQIRAQLGDEIWSSYLKFCVVRNPYEKCVSQYFFRRGWEKAGNPGAPEDPANFTRWLEKDGFRGDQDIYTIDGEVCMDVILRYESLGADLERLCQRLGVPWQPERLPTFKSGIRPAWGTTEILYTPKAREIVRKAFAFELEKFGYSFPERARSGEPA